MAGNNWMPEGATEVTAQPVVSGANGGTWMPNGATPVDTGISGQDIMQHPIGSLAKTILQPAAKSLTGKSLEDMARDKSLSGGDVPVATARPFDSKLGDVQDTAFKNAVGAQVGDAVTTPVNYVGGALLKGASNVIGKVLPEAKTSLVDLMKANQSLKNPVKLDSDIRGAVFAQKSQIGKNFENDLNKLISKKPYDTVNLQEPVSSMRSAMDDANTNPGLASQVKSVIRTIKNPDAAKTLNDILNDPTKAANLTLKQSQDLKVAIQNTPSIKMKLAQGKFANYTQGDLELLDLLDNVKLKQAENFPELAQIRKPYADYMTNYNQVKGMFKPTQLLQNVQGNFGPNAVTEAMARKALPDAANKQIDNIRQVLKLKSAAKTTGKWAGGIAAGAAGVEGLHKVGL